jgi:very-short-patch-repair endonuclease
VLVQGPPGTGKSHTIANLIGHLLAQGKSVLVTSHTTKALRVLRNYVPEKLRPLCVSVLDDDIQSRKELDGAVSAIVDRISASDRGALERDAERAADERSELLKQLREVRAAIREGIADEYNAVVVGGQEWSPSDAARYVSTRAAEESWIPRPVLLGAPMPLSPTELADLYATNVSISQEEEVLLASPLPPMDQLPTNEDLTSLLLKQQDLETQDDSFGSSLWALPPTPDDAELLEDLRNRISDSIRALADERGWEFVVVASGKRGNDARRAWESLAAEIDRVAEIAQIAKKEFYEFGPTLPLEVDTDSSETVLSSIIEHLGHNRSLGAMQLAIRPPWRRFIRSARIGKGVPRTLQHFEVLQRQLILRKARQELAARWERQMEANGAPRFADMGTDPESACRQFGERISRLLQWTTHEWPEIEIEVRRTGLEWDQLLRDQPLIAVPDGDLIRLREAGVALQRTLTARCVAIWRARIEAVFAVWISNLAEDRPWGSHELSQALRGALVDRDAVAYQALYSQVEALLATRETVEYRSQLLNALYEGAPKWATAIAHREGIHGGANPPGDGEAAWKWRQLNDELDRRASVSLDSLQASVERILEEVRRVTTLTIDRFTWAFQLKRVDLESQQALIGWSSIMRRIGAGTGKRVPQLRQAARANMQAARRAVPVWIMPLSRVATAFDPRTTKFDVVIVDEASQSDVTSLLALYLGKQVLVVGDHEQVSPTAVGQDQDAIDALIRAYLDGIPNSSLYDGRLSVYDLARTSFGGTIALKEHFRCVPEIIAFSNALAYDGRIKPLRESASVLTKPHVVAYRVARATATAKINENEAKTIAALIGAIIEQPEYADSTIGVVSLVGEEQAIYAQQLLAKYISPLELQTRRIICGNAAQFQGDERDIMFLSLVDAPTGGPLAMRRADLFKQRFNVAASRARDQMWIVYSLEPSVDLQPGDLRRQLIEFALDPSALIRAQQEAVSAAESPFEIAVIERLIAAGFRVRSQVEVGYYRIDIVVDGGGKHLAIECDGDRWHPISAIPADMARQAILERLGWRFARIRGSAFFRNPDLAMQAVFDSLDRHGVIPEGHEVIDNSASPSELQQRVTRRAAELLREWFWYSGVTLGSDESEQSQIDIGELGIPGN